MKEICKGEFCVIPARDKIPLFTMSIWTQVCGLVQMLGNFIVQLTDNAEYNKEMFNVLILQEICVVFELA